MTPNKTLEQLLQDCVQKANAYIDAVRERGQFDPSVTAFHQAWEEAEALYAEQSALPVEKEHSGDHAMAAG